MPGVLTPLSWTFWGDSSDRVLRKVFSSLGALSRAEAADERHLPDQRFAGIFYGRVAGNLTVLRDVGDRIPGTSGDAVEEQIFGGLESGLHSQPIRRRYPVVAAKAPLAIVRSARQIEAIRRENQRWWRAAVKRPPEDLRAAVALFDDAVERFDSAMRAHVIVTMVAQALYDRLISFEHSLGLDSGGSLTTGYGAMEETLMLQGVWSVAHDQITLDEFAEEHGYHGPSEGDIASRSWREDRSPLDAPLAGFSDVPADRSPLAVERRRVAVRLAAERELLEKTPRVKRPGVLFVLRLARRFMLLRQVGKVAFLLAVDGARVAARSAGAHLEREGVLGDAEDVFYSTVDELCMRAPMPDRGGLEQRKALRSEFLRLNIPVNWSGQPEPFEVGLPSVAAGRSSADTSGALTGLVGSAGLADGRVRIVHDPATESIESGDIIVCATTDPSWAPLLFLAGALVVDIGGAMSHAAIVARELGIPCVMGTIDGTRRLRDGDHIRVDGGSATVTVLERAVNSGPPEERSDARSATS